MATGEDGRPDTISKALWEVADWLDTADKFIDVVFKSRGVERPNSGDSIQTDLRRLSRWFHGWPELDAHASAYLKHFDDEDHESNGDGECDTCGDEWPCDVAKAQQ